MNPNSIIKCFNILKNQLVGVLVVNDVESVEPFSFRVPVGTSAIGNIQRLDNALAGIPARLEKNEQQLNDLISQRESATAELGKPFPQEAELAEKSARLAELDAILNMDRGGDETEHNEDEKPSVLADLHDRAGRIQPADHSDEEVVL